MSTNRWWVGFLGLAMLGNHLIQCLNQRRSDLNYKKVYKLSTSEKHLGESHTSLDRLVTGTLVNGVVLGDLATMKSLDDACERITTAFAYERYPGPLRVVARAMAFAFFT